MMKRTSIFICAILAVILLTSSKPVRVACIGDSITEGACLADPAGQSYPAILQGLLGSDYDVRNFGVSGRVMIDSGDYPYMAEPKYQQVKEFLPDIVTIMLGTNDSKPHNFAHFEDYETDYLKMVKELQALPSHPRIYVCLPPAAEESKFTISDTTLTEYIMPAAKRVAVKKWIDMIDLHPVLQGRPDLFVDGIHPNTEGQKMLAKAIYDAFALRGDTGKPGKRVMFIGDSITDDDWGKKDGHATKDRSNYDLNHIYGHGYVLECALHYQVKYPSKGYKFYNRGISGNRIYSLEERWDDDVFPVHPDVLSILVGVNDTWRKDPATFDYADWERRYRGLIEKTIAFDPDMKIVLGTPFVANTGWIALDGCYVPMNEICRKLADIVRKLVSEYGLTLVDYSVLMDDLLAHDKSGDARFWSWDGVHPTMAGHRKMADLWIKKTAKFMK